MHPKTDCKKIKDAIQDIKKRGNFVYNEVQINCGGSLFVERKGLHDTRYCSSKYK